MYPGNTNQPEQPAQYGSTMGPPAYTVAAVPVQQPVIMQEGQQPQLVMGQNGQVYQQGPQQYYQVQPGQAAMPVPVGYAAPAPGQQVIMVVQNCAGGGAHAISQEFTTCGILMGICFFPIGIICCMAMQQRRCVKCNMIFE